jgi:hypothetical protein
MRLEGKVNSTGRFGHFQYNRAEYFFRIQTSEILRTSLIYTY